LTSEYPEKAKYGKNSHNPHDRELSNAILLKGKKTFENRRLFKNEGKK
jgi:hypothetical protein